MEAKKTAPQHLRRTLCDVACFTAFFSLLYPCIIRPTLNGETLTATVPAELFWSFALYGMAVGGIASLAISAVGHGDDSRMVPFLRVGIAICAVGYLVEPVAMFVDVPNAYVQASGFLFGAGTVPLCIAWCLCLQTSDFRSIVIGCCASCFIAVIANRLAPALPSMAYAIIAAVFLIAGCLPPFMRAAQEATVLPRSGIGHESGNGTPAKDKAAAGTFADLAFVLFTSTIALMLCIAMADSNMKEPFSYSGLLSNSSLGFCTASAIIAAILLFVRKRIELPVLYWRVFPVIAAVLIVADAFPQESLVAGMGAVGVFMFFSALGIMAVAILLAVSQTGEFPVSLLVGGTLLLAAIAGIIGTSLAKSGLGADDRGAILIVVSTVYFAYLMLSPIAQLWRESQGAQAEEDAAPDTQAASESLDERCDAMSADAGLSSREHEVLRYLAQGYSSTYIAKALFISDNTVRTHFKSIYRKLGVNSKMELLDLLKSEGAAMPPEDSIDRSKR